MFFLPGTHKENGLRYSPLKALISPRPIGWISSLSGTGTANLSPYSFFNAIAELPPMVMFISAPDGRFENKNGHKDSLANILETREFGVNIVGREQAGQMVTSSHAVGADIDEFELAGLKPQIGKFVSAPFVAEAAAALDAAGEIKEIGNVQFIANLVAARYDAACGSGAGERIAACITHRWA